MRDARQPEPLGPPARPATALRLPLGVVWEETRSDLRIELFPSEEEFVHGAVGKRRHEFTTVRACAERALHRLGRPRPPMVPGRGGEPPWPEDVVGSMTHTDGYAAAAVALRADIASLGIDAEPNQPLPSGVLYIVSTPPERARLEALAAVHPGIAWDRLLFSAKESVYKMWFPVVGTWLGFDDVELRAGPDGTFDATLTNEERGAEGSRPVPAAPWPLGPHPNPPDHGRPRVALSGCIALGPDPCPASHRAAAWVPHYGGQGSSCAVKSRRDGAGPRVRKTQVKKGMLRTEHQE